MLIMILFHWILSPNVNAPGTHHIFRKAEMNLCNNWQIDHLQFLVQSLFFPFDLLLYWVDDLLRSALIGLQEENFNVK